MGTQEDIELVRRAIARAPGAGNALAGRIGPAIQSEIAHLLMRMAPARGRSARQELGDLIQEAFAALFDRDARKLAGWDPTRGCTLDSYVRLVARSRALDLLRSRRRSPWQPEELDPERIDDQALDESDHEEVVFARETLADMQRCLHELLAPRDYALFVALFVEELPPADVAVGLGMTSAAVYQWSSRFRRNLLPKLVRRLSVGSLPVATA